MQRSLSDLSFEQIEEFKSQQQNWTTENFR